LGGTELFVGDLLREADREWEWEWLDPALDVRDTFGGGSTISGEDESRPANTRGNVVEVVELDGPAWGRSGDMADSGPCPGGSVSAKRERDGMFPDG
jgi:hypothetical protein